MSLLHNRFKGLCYHSGDDFIIDLFGQVQTLAFDGLAVSLKSFNPDGGHSLAPMLEVAKELGKW